MASHIRVWEIKDNNLVQVGDAAFADSHQERELEEWMTRDPNLLGEDLLVIARQLEIPGVGRLDLLCMDKSGRLAVVELKRDRTPREAVAQALDYGSWLDSATRDEVSKEAGKYLGGDLETAFQEHFGVALPDWVCQNHRIILVAPRLDASAERIIKYLAERYGVDVNAVFFNYSKLSDGEEILVRSVLVPDEAVHAGSSGKRVTESSLVKMATERRTLPLLTICREMKSTWSEQAASTAGGSFRYWAVRPDGGYRVIYGINVSGELGDSPPGELVVWVRTESLAEVTEVPEATIREQICDHFTPFSPPVMKFAIRIQSGREAEQLIADLRQFATKRAAT